MASRHVVISENMAAVVRLLPSIRAQMASLTWPLLIFQHALCSHHLETGIRNKLLRTKGPFCIKRRVGGVKVSQVRVRGECVLPATLHILDFLPSTTPPTLMPCSSFTSPVYLHSSPVSPSPPPLPPLPRAEA